jgi:hypothetical protein
MYFESHRILLHGIGQGALVLSEPCTEDTSFGDDEIIFAGINEMPAKINEYLNNKNIRSASEMAMKASEKLSSKRRFDIIIGNLVDQLPIRSNV